LFVNISFSTLLNGFSDLFLFHFALFLTGVFLFFIDFLSIFSQKYDVFFTCSAFFVYIFPIFRIYSLILHRIVSVFKQSCRLF